MRSHVARRINDGEAAIVRRIFHLCANGTGYSRIAKLLNEERPVSPRPQQRRPAGWSPSSVHEILKRPIYRGQITWNQTPRRDRWGRTDAVARPEAEWITIDAPELRIVSDEVWAAARDRLARIKAKIIAASWGKARGRLGGLTSAPSA